MMMMHTPPPTDEFATQRHDPYPWYAQLRATQPLYWTTLANGAPVLLVTRYADVLALLKDARLGKDVFQARQMPWWQRMLFARMNASNMLKSDPPAHTRLRRLASDMFLSTRRINAIISIAKIIVCIAKDVYQCTTMILLKFISM
jgi:cytochrome P450